MFCSAEDSILIHQKPNALCKAKKKKKSLVLIITRTRLEKLTAIYLRD